MPTRSLCDAQILRSEEDNNAGFAPLAANITKSEPVYLPDSDAEWGGTRPRPSADETILPQSGEDVTISCEVQWTGLRIDLKTNLIDEITRTLQTVVAAGVGAMTNEVTATDAISQVSARLRTLVEASRRDIDQRWGFRFTSKQAGAYAFATHNQSCTTYVSRLGVGGTHLEMQVTAGAALRIDGRRVPALDLRLHRDLADTQERPEEQKCHPVNLRGRQHSVSVTTKLTLEFAGFRRVIESIIDDLAEISRELLASGLTAAKVWEKLKEIAQSSEPIAEAERTLDKLRTELADGLKSGLEKLIRVLTEFRGHVIVNTSAVTLTAVKEETYLRLDRTAHGESPAPTAAPSEDGEEKPGAAPLMEPEESDAPAEKTSLPTKVPPKKSGPAKSILGPLETIPAEAVVLRHDEIFPNKSLILAPLHVHRARRMRGDQG